MSRCDALMLPIVTTFDVSERTEDAQVFEEKTGLRLHQLTDKLILDAGCGWRSAVVGGDPGLRTEVMSGFDPGKVLFDNGAVNPFVFDGKPFGQPVARTATGSLTTRCQ